MNIASVFLGLFVVILAVFFIFILYKAIKTKYKLFVLVCIICFGLLFDSTIILLGNFIGEQASVLKVLSSARFILHGALVPLNLVMCAYILDVKKPAIYIWWCITIVIMLVGIAAGFAIDLVVDKSAGIIRYAASSNSPMWANMTIILLSFATIVPVVVCGIIQIVKKRDCYLFFAGFLMFVFSVIAPATGHNELNFLISIPGEILMVFFYYLVANKHR